jgi:hypothetical protein
MHDYDVALKIVLQGSAELALRELAGAGSSGSGPADCREDCTWDAPTLDDLLKPPMVS